MKTFGLLFGAALLVAMGCGSSVSVSGDHQCVALPCPYPGWDPETCQCRPAELPDAAAPDAADDATTAQCVVDSGDIVSPFKTCHGSADCTVAIHTVDCCGTMEYVGIAKADLADFSVCETAWSDSLPACGCAGMPPMAEDGHTVSDSTEVVVACVDFTQSAGICQTSVP